MTPEYGPGLKSRKVGLPPSVEIKGTESLPLAGSPHAAFYQEALQCLPLARLQRIEQSSIGLAYGPSLQVPGRMEPPSYETTRWRHTLEVAVLTEAILTQNRFSPDQVKHGIAAALLHDIATPAMGDVTMRVDMPLLDEEKNWDKVLDDGGRDFLRRHNLDPRDITTSIVNGGVFGEVLDIADRISYVVSDAYEIARTETNHNTELLTHLAAYPDIGKIYQNIKIDGEQVYFTDPEQLSAFLKLRAFLRRDLAEHPYSIGKNRAATNAIGSLVEESVVTYDQLRSMEDGDLYAELTTSNLNTWRTRYRDSYLRGMDNLSESGGSIDDYFSPDSSRSMYYQFARFKPQVEIFSSKSALRRRKEELQKQKNTIIIGEDEIAKFDTGTTYKVCTAEGEIVPFRRHNPRQAEELESIAEAIAGYYLTSKRVVSVTKREDSSR